MWRKSIDILGKRFYAMLYNNVKYLYLHVKSITKLLDFYKTLYLAKLNTNVEVDIYPYPSKYTVHRHFKAPIVLC